MEEGLKMCLQAGQRNTSSKSSPSFASLAVAESRTHPEITLKRVRMQARSRKAR
jgi:hypothetical protein